MRRSSFHLFRVEEKACNLFPKQFCSHLLSITFPGIETISFQMNSRTFNDRLTGVSNNKLRLHFVCLRIKKVAVNELDEHLGGNKTHLRDELIYRSQSHIF